MSQYMGMQWADVQLHPTDFAVSKPACCLAKLTQILCTVEDTSAELYSCLVVLQQCADSSSFFVLYLQGKRFTTEHLNR